jgi:hypothetical protein
LGFSLGKVGVVGVIEASIDVGKVIGIDSIERWGSDSCNGLRRERETL